GLTVVTVLLAALPWVNPVLPEPSGASLLAAVIVAGPFSVPVLPEPSGATPAVFWLSVYLAEAEPLVSIKSFAPFSFTATKSTLVVTTVSLFLGGLGGTTTVTPTSSWTTQLASSSFFFTSSLNLSPFRLFLQTWAVSRP